MNNQKSRRDILKYIAATAITSSSISHAQSNDKIDPLEKSNPIIKLGVTNLSFHRVTAAIVAHVMNLLGKQVVRSYDLHEENFNRLKNGDVDFVSSAWLPHSHGIYKSRVEEKIATRELGLHYEPYAFWGVPDYVPINEVESIEDLSKPQVIARMRPIIQGIGEGAGITRFSKNIMTEYNLTPYGYQFKTGTQADCISAFEEAVSVEDWVIVPLWHPQFLHYKYRIRELKDPKELLGGKDRAVLLAREDSLYLHFSRQEISVLDNINLTNDVISEIDYSVNRLGLTEDEAAKKWLQENTTYLAKWLEPLE
ncbi:glycine betaine ABC transporter substrate-binding protein [Vibrio splendidus]|uniref:glycine betaine ABC transporter substrate-binding protein n=1 Tax=Vibrio splendidus TaxID=29497 RepID=UPI000C85C210|nr:glycine betaine ABC transporter substrate-binding protein [Vibrio splendidus]PMM34907.1 glycine/betaine ABC transporter [Vibrio splendidus]PTP66102.1 glycine/betaine ABC transporter [Vibrio splendidus]